MESYIVGYRKVFGFNALRIGRQMIFILLMLLMNNNLISQPATMWLVSEDNTIHRYIYVGGDEFNGDAFDHSKWFTCEDGWDRNRFNSGEPDCSGYLYYGDDGTDPNCQSTNIIQGNGIVRLIAKHNPGLYRVIRNNHDTLVYCEYTVGWIQQKMKYKHGLFEIRCKMPYGKGLWPAFWLYGGYDHEEIDIFEGKGENPYDLHLNVHDVNGKMDPNDWFDYSPACFTNSYYSIIGSWGPNGVYFHNLGSHTDILKWIEWDLTRNADLIASLGIAKNDCPFKPGPDATTTFPAYFDIDWIRIWSKIDCDEIISVCNYEQTIDAPTVFTGREISFGGQNCNVLLENGSDVRYLKAFATERIVLNSGVKIKSGTNFIGKIVDCPAPLNKMADKDFSLDTLALLKNSDNYNSVEEDKSLSANNPPKLYARIFPNPTDGKIRIEFSGEINPENMKIELINSNGQIVYSGNKFELNTIEIDITALPKGTYILLGTFGNSTVSEKILLQ